MKNRSVILTFAFMMSMSAFAQKDELKALEKATKNGDPSEIKSAITAAEAVITNATDEEKAKFLFLKGNSYLKLAEVIPAQKGENLLAAAKSYVSLIDIEKATGKSKYSSQAQESLFNVRNSLINAAIEDNNANKFKEGTTKLYEAYKLMPKDTVYLYYAANGAVNAQDYDTALELFEKLKDLNYSGMGMSYIAVDKLKQKPVIFNSKVERDLFVKSGSHEKPSDEKIASKRGDIFRTYALILVQKGENKKAKVAIAQARKDNPGDVSLAITEANLYLEENDLETYKKIITEVIQISPNDPDLYYNLGVISSKANNTADAEKYYIKAIEIKPSYKNAYLNLAILKLEKDTAIVDEMNKLGTSAKDNKRYDELQAQRKSIFNVALPYLEKVIELDPDNNEAKTTLLNVYSSLDMTDKYKALKATME